MKNSDFIYFDHNSTSPVDPRVLEAMLPCFQEVYGNAASRSHPFGWRAEAMVDTARQQLSDLLCILPKEIVFTSGATEAVNLAIKGVFESYYRSGNHIITVKTEHKAVLDVCERLEKSGADITYLDVDNYGLIDLDQLEKSITDKTILVSVMWANNETGVLQPMKAIGEICKKHNVLLMSDATQAVGKISIDPKEVGVHLLACSAHKYYGPKGVGALYVSSVNPRIKLSPIIDGGGHERGMRSGTLNVPGIVGMGMASEIASKEMEGNSTKLRALRTHLEKELLTIEESYLNTHPTERLSHVTNISFRYVESEALIGTLNQIVAVSTGSACTSATLAASHVLLAQGLRDDMAHSAIRLSLGKDNTIEEVDRTVQMLKRGVEKIRSQSPVWELFKDGINVDELI